jgi:hypothetical protein
MTFGYLWTLFIHICGTIDPGHTYDEYMVLLVKLGLTLGFSAPHELSRPLDCSGAATRPGHPGDPHRDLAPRATQSLRRCLALAFPWSTPPCPQRPTAEQCDASTSTVSWSNRAPGNDDLISWSRGQIGSDGAREDVNFTDPMAAVWFHQSRRRGWSDRWGGPLRISGEVISPSVSANRTGVLIGEPNAVVLTIEIDVD